MASQKNNIADQISLTEIILFLQIAWKRFIIAGAVGAVLGFGSWYLFIDYSSEGLLANNYEINTTHLTVLESQFSLLAEHAIDLSIFPESQKSLYHNFSNQNWWKNNIQPNYIVTEAGKVPLNFTLRSSGSSRTEAIENLQNTKTFFEKSLVYLKIKSLIGEIESSSKLKKIAIIDKINITYTELDYQLERIKALEVLLKRFPGESKASPQILDPKDSGAKYMTIGTQLIAAIGDVNVTKEAIIRLNVSRAQEEALEVWLQQAREIVEEGQYDGIKILNKLLQHAEQARIASKTGNNSEMPSITEIYSSLTKIKNFANNGTGQNYKISTSKKSMIKFIIGGLVAGFFLMLIAILGQQTLHKLNFFSGLQKD